MTDTDPSVVRSLAISATDAVDAFAYTKENPGTAVLRVTPPFHGRMRARLHVFHVDDADVIGAITIPAEALLDDTVVDEYPQLDQMDGAIQSDGARGNETDRSGADEAQSNEKTTPDSWNRPSQRRKRHAAAVDRWRDRARNAIVDEVTLDVDGRSHTVAVKQLG